MYTLSYYSTSVECYAGKQLEDILSKARIFNSANGITGCLIFYNGTYVQILEGPKESLKDLYSRIEMDRRHSDVRKFSEDKIEYRTFSGWGMAYYPIDKSTVSKSELVQFRNNLALLSELSDKTNATANIFWKRIRYLISISHEGTETG